MAGRVFLSFSNRDILWCDRIRAVLTPLQGEAGIELWDYRGAEPGTVWTEELRSAIAQSDLAILVLTRSFLESTFIRDDELPALLQRRTRGLQILPVLVERCGFHEVPILGSLQIFPGKRAIGEEPAEAQRALLQRLVSWTAQLLGKSEPTQAGTYPPPIFVDVSRLPVPGTRLIGRAKDILALDACWNAFDRNVAYVHGAAGQGKSTLIQEWLSRMEAANYRGARRIFAWSFNVRSDADRFASADHFFLAALRSFGVPEPYPVLSWNRAQLLVNALQTERSLLILDGLEAHQVSSGPRAGRVQHIGLGYLLARMAKRNPGLLIATSRQTPRNLSHSENRIHTIEMNRLSLDDSVLLCESLAVDATRAELESVAHALQGHALSVALFASLVRLTGQPTAALLAQLDQAASPVERILEIAARHVPAEDLTTLGLVGLFDRPVPQKHVEAASTVLGDMSRTGSFARLRELSLVGPINVARRDEVDLHPVVRWFFGELWKNSAPERYQQANQTLYAHMLRIADPSPQRAEDLQPLHDAMVFGCRAGRHQEVLDSVYYDLLLQRDQQRSWSALGAIEADLAALTALFDEPWTTPARGIARKDHGFLVGQAGLYLGILGVFDEAARCLEQGIALDLELNPANASVTCGNLAAVQTLCGRLSDGLASAERSLEYARRAGDQGEEIIALTHVAHVLHYSGEDVHALQKFKQAETLFRTQKLGPILFGGLGSQFCELLLDIGEAAEVIRRCEENIKNAPPQIPRATEMATLALALVSAAAAGGSIDLNAARKSADNGVGAARASHSTEFLPFTLLSRAAVYRYLGMQQEAGEDLEEALNLAQVTGMRCNEAEAHLGLASRSLEMGHRTPAAHHLSEANHIVTSSGYRRRARALSLLAARMGQDV